MYDRYYDEYMRNVLGNNYMPDYRSPYDMFPQDLYGMGTYMQNEMIDSDMMDEELENCYPDIYRIVYPMVRKVCMKNTKPITRKLVDDMVNEIYVNVEPNDSININVNAGNSSKINSVSSDRDIKNVSSRPEAKSEVKDVRGEARQKETRQRNFLLNDLIRILVLRELLDRPSRPNNRPPQRPPMRLPYPGSGGRPPMRPRDYGVNYDLYEY